MIDDSRPWKRELLRVADHLERRTTQRRWTGRTLFLVERDVMTAAYAVRKLHEARKLSDEVVAETVGCTRYALTGTPVDIWNRDKFFEHYDMEHGTSVALPLIDFCNQVIHSWIWMPSATEHAPHVFNGVYVTSDRGRKRHLYFVPADSMIYVFRNVGCDEILSLQMSRDSNGDMQVVTASRRHRR